MAGPQIAAIQQQFRTARAGEAWQEFLCEYSPVVLQAVQYCIWDTEHASDCFVFVCEKLREHNYRRLLQYRPEGPTSFVSWLRVVVRNLALDWHRKQSGRHRIFESIARLSPLHREVYRLRYEKGCSLNETYFALRDQAPGVTLEAVASMDGEVRQSLSSRQEWLLASRTPDPPLTLDADDPALKVKVADPAPGPEALAISREEWQRMARALSRLEPTERLLVELRFSQGVTLAKIAHFLGLPDAQTADRRLRAVLERLRKECNR